MSSSLLPLVYGQHGLHAHSEQQARDLPLPGGELPVQHLQDDRSGLVSYPVVRVIPFPRHLRDDAQQTLPRAPVLITVGGHFLRRRFTLSFHRGGSHADSGGVVGCGR